MVDGKGWSLRWATGLGRQSGFLALNAVAVAGVPFLYGLRPCTDDACTSLWDGLFFVPNLLFIPAIAASLWLCGSWRAQRGHERTRKRFFSELEPRERPEVPPGHMEPPHLERDLVRRTLRGVSLGSFLAALILAVIGSGPWGIGLRRCDPMDFSWHTGLARCDSASGWADALIAFQVWTVLVLSLLAALMLALRARRYREPRPEPRGPIVQVRNRA